MNKNDIGCGTLTLVLLFVAGLEFLFAWFFQMLWNFVMPLFNVITLTYWQAFGVWLLIGLVGSCFKVITARKD